MKRFLIFLCTVSLIFLSVIPPASAATTAYVVGGWLRLRQMPSGNAVTLASYYTGTEVTVLSVTGSWSYVRTQDGKLGYMSSAYLSTSAPSSVSPPGSPSSPSLQTVYVTSPNGGVVAMREGASTKYRALAYLSVGTSVQILSAGSTWDKIQYGNTIGYMMSKYLTTSSPVTPSGLSITAYVTSSNGAGVNLRTGAGTGYGIIGKYKVGTQVTILSQGSVWDYVRIGSRTGYMMHKYLTTTAPLVPVSPGTVPSPSGSLIAYVTSANLKPVRLRSGPGTNFSILGLYAVGTPVTVINRGAIWSTVNIGTVNGYMMDAFLSYRDPEPVPPSPYDPPTPIVYTAYIYSANGNPVNLRMGPSTSSAVIDAYPVGTEVRVLKNQNGWDYVTIGNHTGWILHSYLTTEIPPYTPLTDIQLNQTAPSVGDVLTFSLTPQNASHTTRWLDSNGNTLATTDTYTVQSRDIGRKIRARADGTGYFTGTVSSSYTQPVKEAVQIPLTDINIPNQTPMVGDILTFSLTPQSATHTTRWLDENGNTLATTGTYTVSRNDIGKKIRVRADGTGNYSGTVSSSYTQPVREAVQTPLTDISILNTAPRVGDILSFSLSPQSATHTTRWLDENGNLLASTETYTVSRNDIGKRIRVRADGTGNYSGTVSSSYTQSVRETAQIPLTDISILNTSPRVGDILSFSLTPQNAAHTTRWLDENGSLLSSAETYTVSGKDIGKRIRVRADGTGDYSGTVSSSYTQPVISASLLIQKCTLSDTSGYVGTTVRASVTPSGATASYIWYRVNGLNTIFASSGDTYTIREEDIGYQLYCVATGSGDWSGSATSGKTAYVQKNVPDARLAGSIVLPTVKVGVPLTLGVNVSVKLNCYDVDYVWLENGVTAGTGSSFTPQSSQAGSDLQVAAFARSGSGYTGSVRSNYSIISASSGALSSSGDRGSAQDSGIASESRSTGGTDSAQPVTAIMPSSESSSVPLIQEINASTSGIGETSQASGQSGTSNDPVAITRDQNGSGNTNGIDPITVIQDQSGNGNTNGVDLVTVIQNQGGNGNDPATIVQDQNGNGSSDGNPPQSVDSQDAQMNEQNGLNDRLQNQQNAESVSSDIQEIQETSGTQNNSGSLVEVILP